MRALVRADAQAEALRGVGADAMVADLRGDVEWTAEGCDAAMFAAGACNTGELAAVDAGGAASSRRRRTATSSRASSSAA